jgi:hypothetical protein
MTQPRTTAEILSSPVTLELLHAVAHGHITASPDGYIMYGEIVITRAMRRLAGEDLVELPEGLPPVLTARGEDLVTIA